MGTFELIVVIAGGIAAIGAAAAVIWGWLSPAVKLSRRVTKLEEKQEKDYKRFQTMDETQSLLCQGMIALIDNRITGNNIDGLKKTKQDMIKHLAEK